jgi:hypothetical protein
MLRTFKTSIMALAVLVALASCQNSSSDVRDAARQNIENTGVQPANPNAAVDPNAQAPTTAIPTGPTTTMEFEETTFDFGTVQDGEKVSHTYKFKNTGSEPLVFADAKGSCGCTVPKWPREPIAPGASSQVTVEFDSKGKGGKRNQKVTITANTNPPQTFLYLTGEVAGGTPAAQPQIQVNQ